MDMLIKLTVPNYIYQFYHDASQHVAGSSAEAIMSDALCAYAELLNNKTTHQQKSHYSQCEKPE